MVLLLNTSHKKRQYKKEILSWPACLLHMQGVVGGPIAYIIYVKAVVLVILLTFAGVTFLLQEDFFLVVTSRA